MTRIVYQLAIKPSRLIKLYLLLSHALAVFVTFFSGLDHIYQLLIVVLCLLSFAYYAYGYFDSRSRYFIQRIERDEVGLWALIKGDGSAEKALQLTRAVVGQYCTILYFRRPRSLFDKTVFICADAVDHELYRQLRVFCRDPMTFQQ